MLEKLLSLLLHAKGGAVATVLVLGASGALVTATVENGISTVTNTQPSTTTTASETTTTNTATTNPAILALFNRTSAEQDPTAPATGNGCSDAAHATNSAVRLVNDGFKKDHAAVLALSKDAEKTADARTLVKTANGKINGFRQEAVKAIHELFKSDECKGNVDEDSEQDEDSGDEDASTVAISCTDAKACADAAIAEMDKVVENLKTDLEKLEAAPATTNTNTTPGKSDKANRDNHDNKGKGKGRG
jgi:hypothetical protein